LEFLGIKKLEVEEERLPLFFLDFKKQWHSQMMMRR
jgi:hypothetical protein